MFEQTQRSMLHDDRSSQRNLILLYALQLPIFAACLFLVIKHWRTPGHEHRWNFAWVLIMGVGAIFNIVTRLIRLRKLPA